MSDTEAKPTDDAAPAADDAAPAADDAAPAADDAAPAADDAAPAADDAAPAAVADAAAVPAAGDVPPAVASSEESDEGISPITWLVLIGILAVVVYSLIPTGGDSGLPSGNDVQALLSEGRATAKRSGDDGGVEGALPYFIKAVQVAPEDATANGTLGRALVELSRYDEALPYLERAKKAAPSVHEVNLYLGMCLTGLERHPEARVLLEEALRVRPESPQPLYYLGVGAMRMRDLGKTAEYLGRFVAEVPRHVVALRMYADALDSLGRDADAIAALSSLVALTPQDVAARRSLHTRRIRVEGFEPVLRDAAADTEPEKGPEALYLYSRLLAMSPDRAAETRATLQKLKDRFPNVVRAELDLAIEDTRDGDLEAARKRLEAVLVNSPRSYEARALLADLEAQAKQYEKARSIYQALLGGTLNAHGELGIVSTHLDEGNGDAALKFTGGLLEGASTGDPRRWALEGELLKALGRFDESRKLLDALIEEGREQDRVIWLGYVGFVELERGDDAAAQAGFARLLEAAGSIGLPPELRVWAGVAAYATDVANAREHWEKAAEGPDHDSMALHTRGAQRLLGRTTRAKLLAAARIAGYRSLNDALFFEGLALEGSGDKAGAKKAYDEALAASRGDEFPARLIRRGLERVE